MSCHAFKLFIGNVHSLHLIDSTATASTNISNYCYARWSKLPIELFTNMVEISWSSCRFFYFSLLLVAIIIIIWQAAIHTYGELTNSCFWLVGFSTGILVSQIKNFHLTNYRFLFCKPLTYFHFKNYRSLFCKLLAYFHVTNYRFSFCFVLKTTLSPLTPKISSVHVILVTVCHTVLVMLVRRIWC